MSQQAGQACWHVGMLARIAGATSTSDGESEASCHFTDLQCTASGSWKESQSMGLSCFKGTQNHIVLYSLCCPSKPPIQGTLARPWQLIPADISISECQASGSGSSTSEVPAGWLSGVWG